MPDIMCDTIHANVNNVNPNGPFSHIAGYVSGTPEIIWTPQDWDRFPKQFHIRIEQGYGGEPVLTDYDVLDIERGAWTPQSAADEVERRVMAGIDRTCIYANDADLATTAGLIQAKGDHIFVGHVDCALANWNDSVETAQATVGTYVHGMLCRWVQFASPTSNPDTILPGSSMTLAQANVDLGVVDTSWRPTSLPTIKPPVPPTPVPVPTPVPTPVPVPVPTPTPASVPVDPEIQMNHAGVIVWMFGNPPELHVREVVSDDKGVTWH